MLVQEELRIVCRENVEMIFLIPSRYNINKCRYVTIGAINYL